jgi:hypothetical protein
MCFSLAAVSCAVALAACGSSSNGSSNAASSFTAKGVAFADCMRSHGVPNFPDPSGGGGIHIEAGSGINPFSPSFQGARKACGKLLPGGGPSAHPSEEAKTAMLAISRCMRSHGITDFPDPVLTPPTSPAGYSIVLGRGGVFLEVPATINVGSPAFKQAAAACKFGGGGKSTAA